VLCQGMVSVRQQVINVFMIPEESMIRLEWRGHLRACVQAKDRHFKELL